MLLPLLLLLRAGSRAELGDATQGRGVRALARGGTGRDGGGTDRHGGGSVRAAGTEPSVWGPGRRGRP